MQRRYKLAAGAVVAVLLLLASFTAGYSIGYENDRSLTGSRADDSLSLIGQAYEEILEKSADPPAGRSLAVAAIRGMVESLKNRGDPYALFLNPRGNESLRELSTGQFSGIGVWLKHAEGELEVVSVLPATPARDAGLQRGDVITSIDGQGVAQLSVEEAVERIKGPQGTRVTIGVQRRGRPLEFAIPRKTLNLPNLQGRVIGGNLGYLRLLGFARGAGEQARERVASFVQRGVDGLVLDLRDNGGGLFSEAVDVASVFIEDGPVVSFRQRSERERVYEARGDAFEDLPLVVLVNEGTASAAEIVAGALQDSGRAVALVGAKTYGKASVQRLFGLMDESALKLTTGAYLTPKGRAINGKGIEPDVEVIEPPELQRARAVEILRGIVLSTTGRSGRG